MLYNWLRGVDLKLKYKIWVGTVSMCWAIWICRNDVVFNNARASTPLHVVFRGNVLDRVLDAFTKGGHKPTEVGLPRA
jgi:hypothetical protein